MANEYFHFKQFSIYQDRCAMKVGTDGVLLGAWVSTAGTERILDIGTGTGLIALMLAQRSTALIDAVEIDTRAAEQAKENVLGSRWRDRIFIHAVSFQEYALQPKKYDLIVSNPPYFSGIHVQKESSRGIARQNHTLPLGELLEGVCRLLENTGRFALIYPEDAFDSFLEIAGLHGLSTHRITRVLTVPEGKAKRILAELSLMGIPPVHDELIIEERGRHRYSKQFTKLTADFYLDKH